MFLHQLLRRKALYSGLLGGNRRWLAVGGVLWAGGFLRRVFGGGTPTPRFTYELQSGERFVTVHELKKPTRRQRRKAKRAAAAE